MGVFISVIPIRSWREHLWFFLPRYLLSLLMILDLLLGTHPFHSQPGLIEMAGDPHQSGNSVSLVQVICAGTVA